MDWQQIASLLIVAVTVALLVRRQLRSGESAARSGCGCAQSCAKLRPTHNLDTPAPHKPIAGRNFVKNF